MPEFALLHDDGTRGAAQEATRDYVLALEEADGVPLVTIYGGKITTFRKLAEATLARLDGHLPMGAPWTAEVALPGGDFPVEDFDAQVTALIRDFPFLSSETAIRLMRAYGTRARRFSTGTMISVGLLTGDLGTHELGYLVDTEFAP